MSSEGVDETEIDLETVIGATVDKKWQQTLQDIEQQVLIDWRRWGRLLRKIG